MKRRNPTWGCRRIAQQISLAFGVEIDKDVVGRILAVHFRPESGNSGPSWLTFLGHTNDSLWSADLFRLEIADIANPLGSRCYGSVHPSDYRLWYSPRDCRWRRVVSHVPASDLREFSAQISEHRQRPVISISSVAGEPARSGSERDQSRARRAVVASVRRETDRNDPT
jgi:hypothetical protein